MLKAYAYNASGKCTETRDARGRTWKFGYDEKDRLISCTGPEGLCFKREYDSEDNLVSLSNAKGDALRYSYDARGRCVFIEDASEQVTAFAYDSQDNLTFVAQADGTKALLNYDRAGNLIQTTDQMGRVWSYDYDDVGRKIKEKDPLGNETSYGWSSEDMLTSIINALGQTHSYSYDEAGRVSKVELADGGFETYAYDKAGRLCRFEKSGEQPQEFSYDKAGRMTEQRFPDGESRHFAYDTKGNLIERIDQLGKSTRYEYDGLGNLCRVISPEGASASYAYDGNNQLIEVARDQAVSLRYLRDEVGQLAAIVNESKQEERYTHNRQGKLLSKTDKDGNVTHFEYDVLSRLIKASYQDGRVAKFGYDACGNLTCVDDWSGALSVCYDALNRPVHIVYPQGRELSCTYDAASRRTSMTYPDGLKVTYAYDKQGRLALMAAGDKELRYAYDNFGRLIEKSSSVGAKCCYEYDGHGRVASLALHDAEGELTKTVYTYDARNNKTSKKTIRRLSETSECVDGTNGADADIDEEAYFYDGAKRLIKVIRNDNYVIEYAYDAWGNRTEKKTPESVTEYRYNERLQLARKIEDSDIWDYVYDANGNLAQEKLNGNVCRELSYNGQGYLEQVNTDAGDEISYQYNSIGQMISKTANGITTEFVFDTTRPRAKLLCAFEEGTARSFIWDKDAAFILDDENCHFLATDDLGSPACLFDDKGAVLESYRFDEFGCTQDNSSLHPFSYTGYIDEPQAGICYAQARYYDPQLGRFISPDRIKGTIDAPQSQNEYAYCLNQPLDYIDRDGLAPELASVPNPLEAFYEFWNENIYGTNNDTRQTVKVGEVTSRQYVHTGGGIIVPNRDSENQLTSVSLSLSTPSISLPGNQSFSLSLGIEHEPGSILPSGVSQTYSLSNNATNMISRGGLVLDSSGLNYSEGVTSKVNFEGGGYLATSLSAKKQLMDWPTLGAGICIVALSAVLIFLVVDDLSGIGVIDDALIGPAGVAWGRALQVLSGAVPSLQRAISAFAQFRMAFNCPL
jgi:RHS repeat-associated protein